MAKRGPKTARISWKKAIEGLQAGCSIRDVAAASGVSEPTFRKRCLERYGITASELKERELGAGKSAVKRAVFKQAIKGSERSQRMFLDRAEGPVQGNGGSTTLHIQAGQVFLDTARRVPALVIHPDAENMPGMDDCTLTILDETTGEPRPATAAELAVLASAERPVKTPLAQFDLPSNGFEQNPPPPSPTPLTESP